MKIPAAICTSLILAAAPPFATAQGGGALPPAAPPIIGAGAPPPTGAPAAILRAGGPPPASQPGAGIGVSGLPPTNPATPPTLRLDPPPMITITPAPVPPVPGAANPGAGIASFPALPSTTPPAVPSAGYYSVLPAPGPMPTQPGPHNKNLNLYYESAPATAAAPSPRSGQEIIRAAKLRVLERHYEETLNQMIQLEKDSLAAPPEERAKMEASAQAMQAFLSKLEAELLPLADRPKTSRNTLGLPAPSPRLLETETVPAAGAIPPTLDPPAQTKPELLDPSNPANTPGTTNIDFTVPSKTAREQSLRLAHDKFERARQLHEAGAMSALDFIAAQRDFAVAAAQGNSVKVAEARLTEAKQAVDFAGQTNTEIDRPDSAAADLETVQTRLQEAQKELERARAAAETLNRPGR